MPRKTIDADKLVEKVQRQNSNSSKNEVEYLSTSSGAFSTVAAVSTDTALTRDRNRVLALTRNVRDFLLNYPNKRQANQALQTLQIIEKLLEGYSDLDLPEFYIARGEDGSLGLSWRIEDALLGIAFDLKPKESSWFLLIGKKDTAMRAYGNLYDEIELEDLLNAIISLLGKLRRRQRG